MSAGPDSIVAVFENALAYGAPVVALVVAVVLAGVDVVRRERGATAWHLVPACALLALLTVPMPVELPGFPVLHSEIEATWLFGARAEWVYGNARIALVVAALLLFLARVLRDEVEPVEAAPSRFWITAVSGGLAPVFGLVALGAVDGTTAARMAPTVLVGVLAVAALRGSRRSVRGQDAVLGLCGVAQVAAVMEGWATPFTSDVAPLQPDDVPLVLIGAVLVGAPAWRRLSWAVWFVPLLVPFAFTSWSGLAPPGLPTAEPSPYVSAVRQNCVRPWAGGEGVPEKRTTTVQADVMGWPARVPGRLLTTSCALIVPSETLVRDLPWDSGAGFSVLTTAGPRYFKGGPFISATHEVEVVPLDGGRVQVTTPAGERFESRVGTLVPDIRARVPQRAWSIRVRADPDVWTVQDALTLCDAVEPHGCFWW